MDPVSQVVEERTGTPRSMGPYILLAVALHLAVATAVVVAARRHPSRVIHFPSVSVRLVQMPQARRHRGRSTAARPTAAPRPTVAPRPTAPPAEKPKAAPASKNAMAGLHATPAPTPRATPPAAPEAAGHGLVLAGRESGGQPAIPEDFRFAYYVNRMLTLIESHWYKPPAPPGTTARVRFRIRNDGRLEEIALEASSGIPSFDRAALRALYASNPLPPLPPAYHRPSLTVHLAFTE